MTIKIILIVRYVVCTEKSLRLVRLLNYGRGFYRTKARVWSQKSAYKRRIVGGRRLSMVLTVEIWPIEPVVEKSLRPRAPTSPTDFRYVYRALDFSSAESHLGRSSDHIIMSRFSTPRDEPVLILCLAIFWKSTELQITRRQ